MNQIGLRQAFAACPRAVLAWALTIGVLSTYLALIPLNLLGAWTDLWSQHVANAAAALFLALASTVTILFKRGWLVLAAIALVTLIAYVPHGLRSPWGFWEETWTVWVYSAVALGLTAIGALATRKSLIHD